MLPVLERLVSLVGNSIPYFPVTDAGWLAIACTLALDRRTSASPLTSLDPSCWSPWRLRNRPQSSSMLLFMAETRESSTPGLLVGLVRDTFTPFWCAMVVAVSLLCYSRPTLGGTLSAPPVLWTSTRFSRASRVILHLSHISGLIESSGVTAKGYHSSTIWWTWKVTTALSSTGSPSSGVNFSLKRHIRFARSSLEMHQEYIASVR